METQTKIEKVRNFLSTIELPNIDILDYLQDDDIEYSRGFDDILDILDNNRAFDIDIIYYSNAINYLKENDSSLRESLEIANDLGYKVSQLNSELLASLLASQNEREVFYNNRTKIESFFEALEEQEEEN